jgi:hypothetical protein
MGWDGMHLHKAPGPFDVVQRKERPVNTIRICVTNVPVLTTMAFESVELHIFNVVLYKCRLQTSKLKYSTHMCTDTASRHWRWF